MSCASTNVWEGGKLVRTYGTSQFAYINHVCVEGNSYTAGHNYTEHLEAGWDGFVRSKEAVKCSNNYFFQRNYQPKKADKLTVMVMDQNSVSKRACYYFNKFHMYISVDGKSLVPAKQDRETLIVYGIDCEGDFLKPGNSGSPVLFEDRVVGIVVGGTFSHVMVAPVFTE